MRFTLPLLALAALAIPTAAMADTVTVRVGYGDVDVTTAEGRAALEARIDARLKKACAIDTRYTFGRTLVDSSCLTEARVAAKSEIERVALRETRGARAVAAN